MPERKILIITNRVPYPLNDGGNLAMNSMIQGYHNSGYKVYLLAMNTSRHHLPHSKLAGLFTNIHAFNWVDVNNDIKPVKLLKNLLFSKKPEHAERFYDQEFEDNIVSILHEFKPDVVQLESVYLATYYQAIKDNSWALTVLRLHNIEFQIWQSLASKSKPLKKIYLHKLATRVRNFERAAWREFDLLLPITEKDANLVGRIEEVNEMQVAPFSIDLEQIKAGKNERWVGYHIGAMDWLPNQAGIKWFIEKVWPKVLKAVPSFEFYFAGRNMPQQFNNRNAAGVHCMNEVANAEEFIADKKILIVPITSGGGIRVKILEAMAAKKVVISTKAGIKGINARAGVHYLLANSPDEFVDAIKWCFDHRAEAETMGEKAYKLVHDEYELRNVIKSVVDKIEAMLNSRT